MSTEIEYQNWLKKGFGDLINSLDLEERQKHILKSRWLDQVAWMERKTVHARNRYYALRLTAIIGGLIVPALIGLNFEGSTSHILRWVVFALSLIVAICSAMEEFFKYGERWRHYRQTVETLKSEGWQFIQLSGAYSRRNSHAHAYEKFAGRVEAILQEDVRKYISEVVSAQTDDGEEG
jgi:hypothetical protein